MVGKTQAFDNKGDRKGRGMNEYMTSNEVMKFLRISRSTLYRMKRDKRLVGKRIGRPILYEKKYIESLLKDA